MGFASSVKLGLGLLPLIVVWRDAHASFYILPRTNAISVRRDGGAGAEGGGGQRQGRVCTTKARYRAPSCRRDSYTNPPRPRSPCPSPRRRQTNARKCAQVQAAAEAAAAEGLWVRGLRRGGSPRRGQDQRTRTMHALMAGSWRTTISPLSIIDTTRWIKLRCVLATTRRQRRLDAAAPAGKSIAKCQGPNLSWTRLPSPVSLHYYTSCCKSCCINHHHRSSAPSPPLSSSSSSPFEPFRRRIQSSAGSSVLCAGRNPLNPHTHTPLLHSPTRSTTR